MQVGLLLFLGIHGVLASGSHEPPANDVAQQQGRKLIGSWKLVEIEAEGQREKMPTDGKLTFALEITASRIRGICLSTEDGETEEASYTLTPVGGALVLELSADSGSTKALCRVEGDTLTLARAEDEESVPTSFSTKAGSAQVTFIYRRTNEPSPHDRKRGQSPRSPDGKQSLLEGAWQVVGARTEGRLRTAGENVINRVEFVFSGKNVETRAYVTKTGFSRELGTYKSFSANGQACIDFLWLGEDSERKAERAIYKVEGETLTICVSTGKDRPTSFESSQNPEWHVIVCIRKKEKPR